VTGSQTAQRPQAVAVALDVPDLYTEVKFRAAAAE
jgi:hypothetical protein